jgi:tetratricopeptide (TPR) repeat protein
LIWYYLLMNEYLDLVKLANSSTPPIPTTPLTTSSNPTTPATTPQVPPTPPPMRGAELRARANQLAAHLALPLKERKTRQEEADKVAADKALQDAKDAAVKIQAVARGRQARVQNQAALEEKEVTEGLSDLGSPIKVTAALTQEEVGLAVKIADGIYDNIKELWITEVGDDPTDDHLNLTANLVLKSAYEIDEAIKKYDEAIKGIEINKSHVVPDERVVGIANRKDVLTCLSDRKDLDDMPEVRKAFNADVHAAFTDEDNDADAAIEAYNEAIEYLTHADLVPENPEVQRRLTQCNGRLSALNDQTVDAILMEYADLVDAGIDPE